MFEVFKIFARLGLDAGEFQNNLSEAERRLGNAQQTFGNAGRTLTTGLTLPLAGVGVAALKVGGDFELSMNQVRALTSATEEDFASLRDMAKDLGATTQFSASEAADAMGFLAMAGQDTDEILGSMPGTLLLAAAAQLDMASAADIVTNIMAGFGMEVEELDGAVDVLVQAFTSANTNLPQLAEAMKYAGPVANAAGVGFEEAAAAISLMGNAGIQGAMAGTSLRGAIARILNPTAKASELMASMGLSGEEAAEMMEALEGSTDDLPAAFEAAGLSFTDAAGRLLPLDEIIQQLEPHADDAGLFMELFGQRAGPAMAALVGQGSDALTDLTTKLHDSGGRAQEVADVQMEGLTGAMRLFKSAAEAVLIAIADSGLLEAATNFLTTIAGWVQNLSEVNPIILRVGTVLGGLLAAIGPVLMIVGSFAGAVKNLIPIMRLVPGAFTAIRVAVTALTGPIGLIITGITLLVTAFATDFMGIRTAVVNAWNAVTEAFRVAWDWIKTFFRDFGENMRSTWDAIKGVFTGAATAIGDTFTRMGDGLRRAWDGIKTVFTGARDHVTRAFTGMSDAGQNMVTAVGRLFRGDFRGAWDAAKDAITGWWDTVNNFLGGIPERMLNFGRDIITGLVDGVTGMIGNAVDAVKDVGNNIISGFKNLLGIESPSKTFYGFGRDIGHGLEQGVRDSGPGVSQAMRLLATTAMSSFELSASGAFTAENIVAGVIDGLDAPEAKQAVRDRIKQLHDANMAGFAREHRVTQELRRTQIDALEDQLASLNRTIKETTAQTNQVQKQSSAKFAQSVERFDDGVKGQEVAQQRYGFASRSG